MTVSPITSAAAGRSAALAGIGYMLVAVFLFGLTSAMGKWMVARYPVGEFLAIRSSATLLLLVPLIWRAGVAAFRNAPRPGLQLLRVALTTVEVAMFFWAVNYMPLADATTFYLAGPIYVTALSVPLLGERVGWRRWSAVLIGFCGVLLALRPSSASITLPALTVLCGSVLYSLVLVMTRMLRQTSDTVLMLGQYLGAFAVGTLTAPFGWTLPSAYDFAFMASLGLISVVSLYCTVRALKLASASIVVPYQYLMIFWSVLFGWLLFGELPDIYTVAGATIIIATGLYIYTRERVLARRAPP
jgi:drug/metabolite transporter (DMT)-like permease